MTPYQCTACSAPNAALCAVERGPSDGTLLCEDCSRRMNAPLGAVLSLWGEPVILSEEMADRVYGGSLSVPIEEEA